jgi:hypothetical protein
MTKEKRLLDIYAGAAIALLLLTSTASAPWMAALALALIVAGLVLFPTEPRTSPTADSRST